MGYIDLLIARTPGKKITGLADNAGKALRNVNDHLPELERLGKTLPKDPIFGNHGARQAARHDFANALWQMDDAADTARSFTRRNSTTSFYSVRSNADEALDWTRHLRNKYGGVVPARMEQNLSTAQWRAASAVDELDRAGTVVEWQRDAAYEAAYELRVGADALRDANVGIDRMLAPFARHDEVRIAAERLSAGAAKRTGKAAKVNGVASDTRAKAAEAARTTAAVRDAIHSLEPGASTADVAAKVNSARAAVEDAAAAARLEPTPEHFGLKVAAAWTPIGLGLAGAGFGVYKAVD